jgi:hypothetical protein
MPKPLFVKAAANLDLEGLRAVQALSELC